MFRTTIRAALAATLLMTTAYAKDAPTIKAVEVTADIAAIENPMAAKYWATLTDDLQNAILSRITNQISDDGANLSVDISEVELSNSFQEVLNVADTKLVGQVKVTSETDNTRFNTYELTVNVDQVAMLMPKGTDMAALTQDSREYYDAMINAFADGVVARLDQ